MQQLEERERQMEEELQELEIVSWEEKLQLEREVSYKSLRS